MTWRPDAAVVIDGVDIVADANDDDDDEMDRDVVLVSRIPWPISPTV